VHQEVPGEPRFGMDISYEPPTDPDTDPNNDPPDTWNNLAWDLFGHSEPAFVRLSPGPKFKARPHRPFKKDEDDISKYPWGKSAANLAYALFQTPVMVAVHSSEMLPKEITFAEFVKLNQRIIR
jgi:hypothetical protein